MGECAMTEEVHGKGADAHGNPANEPFHVDVGC